MAITTAWAGEQTITISRNDGQFDNAQGVYYASKGGVTMTMSGGMNNVNFLVLRHQNTVTFRSANFAIKKIVFHCLDDFEEGNNDVFYWGPTTMNVMPVNYKPAGSSTTTAVVPGKFTASGYDGTWVSSFSGTWTSTFRPTNGSGTETRTHTSFANGWPAGNQLIFGSLGKPVRFSSIDIVIEKEDGDIYELVTNNSQVTTGVNYLLVGRATSTTLKGRAMSVYNSDPDVPSNGNILSTQVDLLDNGYRVKANDSVQFIHLRATSDTEFPWYLGANDTQSFRTNKTSTGSGYNKGYQLLLESNPASNNTNRWLFYTKITINGDESSLSSYNHNAVIKYYDKTYNTGGTDFSGFEIRHNNDYNWFKNLDASNGSIRQQVYLYKPSQKYRITYEVKPEVSAGETPYGEISLRDGVIVENVNNNNNYTSQFLETVSFMVTPADGKKISNVTIQAGTETIEPQSATHTTNGTLYTFVMPANDVHIIATFEEVVYHNVYTVVKPNINYGNIFLTEGYVVQQDQVKSFDGENIVFNITANPKDPENENSELYDLYSVVVTKTATGEKIPYTYADGNYSFTMPDCEVTITATFVYENGAPLYLLGTANGNETWLPYGPRFNYDPDAQQYYLDVYFKGTGNYGDQTGDSNGYFSFVWKQASEWNDINNQNPPVRGVPTENNLLVDTSTGGYRLYYQGMDNLPNTFSENNAYKIPAGIYRFYVKSYGYQNDWLYITKTDPTLTFNPAGGTADAPEQVSKGQTVTLAGDLYSKIMAINPDESATNFMYKAVKTIGDNSTAETENATGATTAITTLTEVNDGETVTELHGYNYLGWIVADNTAYYKVIDTSLKWIEENANPGDNVVVSNELVGVYRANSSLWCKDQLPYKSYDYLTPFSPDYMAQFDKQGRSVVGYDNDNSIWDQSNWVELDFSNLENGAELAASLQGKKIQAATVKGVYTKPNHKIVLTSAPAEGEANAYAPNTFSPVNFMAKNLDEDGAVSAMVNEDGTNPHFFFLNPKVQEYGVVTNAVWVDNNTFVVPARSADYTINGHNFDGAFTVDWSLNNWDCFNEDQPQDQSAKLNEKEVQEGPQAYQFHAIIRKPETNGSSRVMENVPGKDVQPDGTYLVYPLDLIVNTSHIVTAVQTVGGAKAVQSVTYCDLAGRMSSKPFAGINIVVTRYTDGTVKTSKLVF